MPDFRRLLIILVGISTGFAILLAAVERFAQPVQDGLTAPADTASLFAASFTDTQGRSQPLAQWRNRVLVVNFWASWCPPCRDEMPELSDIQDRYRELGVVVLGISTDDAAIMQQFAQMSPVSYPLLAGEAAAMDLAIELGNQRRALPYTIVLRRDGSIAASHVGRIDPASLERTLLSIL